MSQLHPIKIHENHFILSANRCLFWEEEQILLLSDCHMGKTGHFRKAGLAIPQAVFKEDLQRMMDMLQQFQPKKMMVIGDMFHSDANLEHELFLRWRNDMAHIPIHLIRGNHDVLQDDWYAGANIELHNKPCNNGPFQFRHDLNEGPLPENQFVFSGHIHPGVVVKGLGKQSLRFPCFYFSQHFAVLPAFSKFTGSHALRYKKSDRVFAVVNQSIIPIQ